MNLMTISLLSVQNLLIIIIDSPNGDVYQKYTSPTQVNVFSSAQPVLKQSVFTFEKSKQVKGNWSGYDNYLILGLSRNVQISFAFLFVIFLTNLLA